MRLFIDTFCVLVSRLEEKESVVKVDYDKLHDRYTEVYYVLLLTLLLLGVFAI